MASAYGVHPQSVLLLMAVGVSLQSVERGWVKVRAALDRRLELEVKDAERSTQMDSTRGTYSRGDEDRGKVDTGDSG